MNEAPGNDHYAEASRARDRFDRDYAILQRAIVIRTLLMVTVCAMIYGYFGRVLTANRHLEAFGKRSAYEMSATVASFMATNLEEQEYTLSLNRDAQLLRRIADDVGAVRGATVPLESRFSVQLATLLAEARERPDQIRFNTPYLGQVTMPIGYATLAFLSVVASFITNLILLLRQIELRAVNLYAAEHLIAAQQPSETVEFAPDFGAGRSIWRSTTQEWSGASRVIDFASGVGWKRLAERRFSLFEVAAAVITAAASLMLLLMACYLLAEDFLRSLSEPLALTVAGTVAAALMVLMSLLLRTIARHVFASAES